MDRRPITSQVRQWLRDELNSWQAAGILSNDQPARILDLYETPAEIAQRKHSVALFALSSIAALMIGLAALLLVSYNWHAMSAALKLVVIFGVLLGSFAAASYLRYQSQLRLTSEIVFFLACIFYGAAIWLIAQIFNIQSHYPNAFWYWAIGILPFVLCLDTLLMHALYAGLLAIWVGSEIIGFPGFRFFWWFGHFANGAYTLPLLVLPGLVWAYRKQSPATVAIYAPLLAWWTILQPFAWHWDVNPIYFIGLAGALLILIAQIHRSGSRMAIPYRIYGVLIAGGVLVPMSFSDFRMDQLHYGTLHQNHAAAIVIALIGAAAMLGTVVLQQRDAADRAPFAAILKRQWLPLMLVVLMAGTCFWCGTLSDYDQSGHAYYNRAAYELEKWSPEILVPTAAANVAMLALALWLMRCGLREERGQLFAAGVLYFLLWATLRYIDLFSDVGGMLGAAAMFLLCGVGLFAVARFWQTRKESLSAAADLPGEPQQALLSPFAGGVGRENGVCECSADTALNLPPLSPAATPSWLSKMVSYLKSRERTFLFLGVAIQLCVLSGMIMLRAMPHLTGQTVLLRIVPVDPRDLFRGDYVTLSYEFSQLPAHGVAGLPPRDPTHYGSRDDWQGRTVYVSLVPEEDGEHYRAEAFSTDRPTDGLFLRGTISGYNRLQFGIESYYVEEGTGGKYEQAARTRQLSAEVAVAPDGQASLCKLHIDAEAAPPSPALPAQQPAWHYSPSDTTYRVGYVPNAEITLDGKADDPVWSRANVERQFRFPWKKGVVAPATEFRALCDDNYLYFTFQAEDTDIFTLDTLRDKEDICFEDRVEMFFSVDRGMSKYYGLEIDPLGRVYDYKCAYYRDRDTDWSCSGLETKSSTTPSGYVVEGRIPLESLVKMGFPRLSPGVRVLCGLYRAEFSHDRSGKPVEQKETIHNHGRKLDITPPVEDWISWIDPKTPEPDFHVPSSLGWLEIVE